MYFAVDSNNDGKFDASDKTIDGTKLPDEAIALYDQANGCIKDGNITTLNLSNIKN